MLPLILGFFGASTALATADGPDFYKPRNSQGQPLSMHAKPAAADVVGSIPADAKCIRNMGCQGTDLSPNPRWCKVEYKGLVGWVQGQLLSEGACSEAPAGPILIDIGVKPFKVSGAVKANDTVIYRVKAMAGQTLSVNLSARHPQIYFNVTPVGSQESMYIGSSSGNVMKQRVAADGEYTVMVYLMRAAARRGASSSFNLTLQLTGQALPAIASSRDALVAGTAFHATASIPCTVPYNPGVSTCEAGVVRRGLDGTATVQVKWPQGTRQILFEKGKLAASDSPQPMQSSRQGDRTILRIVKDEMFEIPDALLTGG